MAILLGGAATMPALRVGGARDALTPALSQEGEGVAVERLSLWDHRLSLWERPGGARVRASQVDNNLTPAAGPVGAGGVRTMRGVGWNPVNGGDADHLARALAQARQGDVAAFNVLVVEHQRQVYNLCFRTLGNRDDAADAAQEAFVHAFRAVSGFDGPSPAFRGWLLRIAVNGCYDLLRRRQRRPSESLEALEAAREVGGPPAPLGDPAPTPEDAAMTAETARRIQAGLDGLPAEQRLAVVLCDVQGFSYEEAAAAMQVELGTVKSRLSRARAALRDYLRRNGELPSVARRLESES